MATTYEVQYVDGSSERARCRAVHRLRAERAMLASGREPGIQEQVLLIVWATVTGGTGSLDDFESWAETVDDWDRVEDDDVPPAQGSDTSLT